MSQRTKGLLVSAGIVAILILVGVFVNQCMRETADISSTPNHLPFLSVRSDSLFVPSAITEFLNEHPQFGVRIVRCTPQFSWTPDGRQVTRPKPETGRFRVETEKGSYLFALEEREVVLVWRSATGELLWLTKPESDSTMWL